MLGMRPLLPVLYAEGNSSDGELAQAHFAKHANAFALEIVPTAAAFLELARKRRHVALIIAQRLPDMDGLNVLKLLVLEGVDTPVLLITEWGDAELASQALRLGADDYILKRHGYLEALPRQLQDVLDRCRQPGGTMRRVRPRRILAVQDKHSEGGVLVRELTVIAPHLSVETVSAATQALAQLGDRDFDLVISDHCPPEIDGFELLVEMRHRGWRTPFILVASTAREEMVVSAFKLGASDYVLKHARHYAELALRIDVAVDRHDLMLANERAADELSERKRILGSLREREKQLSLALEAGRVGLWSWHVVTGETHFSTRWKAQIGHEDDEIPNDGREWQHRCHADDYEKLKATTARYLAAPWPNFTIEYRLRHKDGGWRWFMLHADLEYDESGRPIRMLGSQVDITSLKNQQAELSGASARLQQLSRRLLAVQEQERRHLARELHDEIGQVLTVAKMQLQSTALASEAAPILSQIQEPIMLLDRLLAQVRSLSLDLRPPLLDDLGLVAAINWLVQQHPSRPGLPAVQLAADPAVARYEAHLEIACFRIAQEALTNAIRHSRAQKIALTLSTQGGSLRLTVRDDGRGFDAAAARTRAEQGGSLGLLGMHERASLAGGKLTLLSAPGRGTEVEAVFPLSNPTEAV